MSTVNSARLRRAMYPLVIIAAVVVPVLITALMGGLSIPRNDDWNYEYDAFRLHSTGHFHLLQWTSAMIVGLLLWAQPFLALFGEHKWVLGLSVAVLELLGLWAIWDVSSFALGKRRALLAIAVLVFGPGYLNLATSFMSDLPAISLQFISLAFALRAIRGGRLHLVWFIASITAGVAAFSIRELSIAVIGAVLIAAIYATRDYKRTLPVVALAIAGCAAMYIWRQHMVANAGNEIHLPSKICVLALLAGSFTVGLAVLPAVVWRVVNRQVSGATLFWGCAFGAVLLSSYKGIVPFVGNMWANQGVTGSDVLSGNRFAVIPSPLWDVLTAIGTFSIACAMAMLVAKIRNTKRVIARPTDDVERARLVLISYAVCSVSLIVVFALISRVMDRYTLPSVFGIATLLLLSHEKNSIRFARPAVLVALLLPAALSMTLLLNSNAYDVARWDAAQDLVDSGVPANSIDGGIEWVGLHSGDGAAGNKVTPYTVEESDTGRQRWITAFAVDYQCFVITNTELNPARYQTVSVAHYHPYGFWGSSELYVQMRIDQPCRDKFANRLVLAPVA